MRTLRWEEGTRSRPAKLANLLRLAVARPLIMSHSLEHSFLPTTTHDSVVKEDGGSIKSAKLTSKEPAGMEEVGEVVQEGQYRLYRMRFAGCAALVVFNIVAARESTLVGGGGRS